MIFIKNITISKKNKNIFIKDCYKIPNDNINKKYK